MTGILLDLILTHFNELLTGESLIPLEQLSGEMRDIGVRINFLIKKWAQNKNSIDTHYLTLSKILDAIPQGVFWKDVDSVFLGCNDIFAKMINYDSPDQIIGKTDYELTGADRALSYRKDDLQVLRTGEPLHHLHYTSSSRTRWTDTSKIPLVDATGTIYGVLGVSKDITAIRLAAIKLQESEHKFRTLAESITESMWMMDSDFNLTYVNPANETLTGYSSEEAMSLTLTQRFPPETIAIIKQMLLKRDDPSFNETVIEADLLRKDGTRRTCLFRVSILRDEFGKYFGTIGTSADITEKKKAEQELIKLATTDSLTGAYNRRYFLDRLQHEMVRSRRYHTPLSIIMLDIDHFKKINDTYGHPAGDTAIVTLVKRVTDCLRKSDFMGRLGGEEFCLMLPDTDSGSALLMAERVRSLIEDCNITHEFLTFKMTVSLGIAELGPDDTDQSIMSHVDLALYESKNSGRNRVTTHIQ